MHLDLIATHIARRAVSDLTTSALPGAPVRRYAERRPAKRLRRRP